MALSGRAFKFGDDINTDYIIAGKYRSEGLNMELLAKHLMEDIDPDFVDKIEKGDFIVGGENFGCGSSREYAAKVIIEAGVSCVIAKSFARIFYRNAINSGLPVIECDTSQIKDGDDLEVNLDKGQINNKTKDQIIEFREIPPFMAEIISCGGLVEYLKTNDEFQLK